MASFKDQLKQFLVLIAKSGLSDGERLVLRELGLRTPQVAYYPGLERKFVVLYDPVWRWIRKGVREPGVLKFVTDHVHAGDTVIDIGAHVGEWTLLFSELVGRSGRVVAFEPDPVARASLTRNLESNRISNVRVESEGVSDRSGLATLAADRFGSGLSSIVRPASLGSTLRSVEVETTTLDQYCESRGLFPDWIKIDAEGAEPLIVRGMGRLIQRLHPSVILEFHSDALSAGEKNQAWSTVVEGASTVEFLQSRLRDHAYLEKLPKGYVPDCGFLVVYIKY